MKKRIAVLIVILIGLDGRAFGASSGSGGPSRSPGSGESVVNQVLQLDGEADYVRVADSQSFHSLADAITIEFCFKASSFYTDDGNVNSIIRKNVGAGAENFLLRFRIVGGRPLAEMSPGRRIGTARAPYEFTTGRWYHLAGVYDGKTVTVLVDGGIVHSERLSGPMSIDESDLLIGKGDPEFSFGEYFHGDVDEIRIWNVARPPEEIRATMNRPLSGEEAGLVAYWNFDDGTAKDQSGHGNDGLLCEGAQIVESARPAVQVLEDQVGVVPGELTAEGRLEVLESLWRNLNEIYPALEYKGIYGREWIGPAEAQVRQAKNDEEFYGVLLELTARLNDTHTRIISYPGRPAQEAPPVVLNEIEGQVAVVRAHPDTALAPGDVVVSVDGRPAQECLAEKIKRVCNSTERGRVREACGQLLQGAPGTEVAVTVRGANSQTRRVTLRRERTPEFWNEPTIASRELGSSAGYIRISRWAGGDTLVEEFDRILEKFKRAKGIIIDVRGNGGGNDRLADLVNGRLTDKSVVSSIDFWRKPGSDVYNKSIGWVHPRGPWTYEGRVAVLIDEASMSACEHFVSGVEAMGNILLVGAPTNGAGGGPTTVRLPDGTRVAISRALGLRANGVVFEGHGIPPHIFSVPTLDDLRRGRDGALEIAKDWILSGQDIPARSQSLARSSSEPDVRGARDSVPVLSEPSPTENKYDTDLSVTHLDISLKADFQSNNVPAVVEATVENTSPSPVEEAKFWLCPAANDPHFGADVKHIYLLEHGGAGDLPYTIREIPDFTRKGDRTWKIYQVPLPKPVRAGETLRLRFEYTMTGQSDHSSAPIEQSKEGVREIYLRGGDYLWCPTPYYDLSDHLKVCPPDWTLRMEYPAGYVAVTNGELLRRKEEEGLVKDEWKSVNLGIPYLYVSQYKMMTRTANGTAFELYVPDETILKQTMQRFEKYARMYDLYSELFGDPGYPTYRIVGSAVSGVGASFNTGFMTHMGRLQDTHHIAHEMAHTWWGGPFSAYGEGSKFLSEALAEFSARWVLRAMGEEDEDYSLRDDCVLGYKQRQFCTYLAVLESARRLPAPLMFQEGYDPRKVAARNYHWGPLVVNQIRLILGDEVFFRSLRMFLDKYRGRQVGIDEFVATINTVAERDMTPELRGLLWSTGFASYRLEGFVSEKAGGRYRTKVRIRNDGDYGLTCPLLLRTIGGDQQAAFKVESRQSQEFIFTTAHKVIKVVIDPDSTTLLQYHPEQKLRLWRAMLTAMEGYGYGNNEAYGKSYMDYALGDFSKAVDPISEYLEARMKHKQAKNIDELLSQSGWYAAYVFMRGIFYLGINDRERAESDVKSAFPYMLGALQDGESVDAPSMYYEVGAIRQKDLAQYLALLSLIAGREFTFESGLDEAAKKRKVEQWKQWWEKEGKAQKLNLSALKQRFEADRNARQQHLLNPGEPFRWSAGDGREDASPGAGGMN